LANAHFHTLFDVDFCDHTTAGRRDGANRFLRLKLHDRLIFFDLVAFGDQDAYNRAALDTFSELGKFDVHEEDADV
jgi:hypothetical protein